MNTDGHRCARWRREGTHEERWPDIATFSGRSPSGATVYSTDLSGFWLDRLAPPATARRT